MNPARIFGAASGEPLRCRDELEAGFLPRLRAGRSTLHEEGQSEHLLFPRRSPRPAIRLGPGVLDVDQHMLRISYTTRFDAIEGILLQPGVHRCEESNPGRRWFGGSRSTTELHRCTPGETMRWCTQPGSNRRPRVFQTRTLPLSYRCIVWSQASDSNGAFRCFKPLHLHDCLPGSKRSFTRTAFFGIWRG